VRHQGFPLAFVGPAEPWLLRDTALRASCTPTRCSAVLMLSSLITVVDERNLGTQAEPAPPKPMLGGLRRTASGNLVPVADDAPIQCAAASLAQEAHGSGVAWRDCDFDSAQW